MRKIRDLAVEFTGASHFRRGSGGPFWDNFEHSFEGRPDRRTGQGAGMVQRVWTGVEKEENETELVLGKERDFCLWRLCKIQSCPAISLLSAALFSLLSLVAVEEAIRTNTDRDATTYHGIRVATIARHRLSCTIGKMTREQS